MSKPVNKHPYRLGNEHAEVKFGHIIKELNSLHIMLELVMMVEDITLE